MRKAAEYREVRYSFTDALNEWMWVRYCPTVLDKEKKIKEKGDLIFFCYL